MSVLEIVRTTCVDGKAVEMRGALERAMAVFSGVDGCHGAKALQGVESEDSQVFHLLIEWDSVDAHLTWRDSKTESRAWFVENVRPLMAGTVVGHFVQFAES